MSAGTVSEPGSSSEQNRRPVTPNAERFLRAVVDDVTAKRLAELHLFASLRQGLYETGVAVVAVWPAQGVRDDSVKHTVHTARYRAAVKGPDRGKWEFECTAEADAPLVTVETVVRGVLQRSGDTETPVRYDHAALSYVLSLPEPEGEVEVALEAKVEAELEVEAKVEAKLEVEAEGEVALEAEPEATGATASE